MCMSTLSEEGVMGVKQVRRLRVRARCTCMYLQSGALCRYLLGRGGGGALVFTARTSFGPSLLLVLNTARASGPRATACWTSVRRSRVHTRTHSRSRSLKDTHSRRLVNAQAACDRLLNFRVEVKVASKRINDVLNRIHVAQVRGVTCTMCVCVCV